MALSLRAVCLTATARFSMSAALLFLGNRAMQCAIPSPLSLPVRNHCIAGIGRGLEREREVIGGDGIGTAAEKEFERDGHHWTKCAVAAIKCDGRLRARATKLVSVSLNTVGRRNATPCSARQHKTIELAGTRQMHKREQIVAITMHRIANAKT